MAIVNSHHVASKNWNLVHLKTFYVTSEVDHVKEKEFLSCILTYPVLEVFINS